MPKAAPVAEDVSWEALGRSYEIAGGSIKQAVIRAATRAALRMQVGVWWHTVMCLCIGWCLCSILFGLPPHGAGCNMMLLIAIQDGASQITMTDLREEAQDEVSKSGGKGHPFGMYT